MTDQVVAKKKRIRAGHKASTSRIIAQVSEEENVAQCNVHTLRRMVKTLKEKLDIILKLDAEILDAAKEEDEIKEEIETADIYQEKVELAVITLEMAISDLERNEPLATTNGNTGEHLGEQSSAQSSSRGTQASATNDAAVTVAQEPQRDGENRVTTEGNRSATDGEPERSVISKVKLPKMVLKKFDGQLTNWATFWDMFVSSVHTNSELSDIDRFNYLHSLLEGPAADAVSGLLEVPLGRQCQ